MNRIKKVFLISFLAGSSILSVFSVQGQRAMFNESSLDAMQTTFSAGADVSTCKSNIFVTQAFCNSPVLTLWESSGDGVFENSNELITVYTPGIQDIINGQVTLTLILLPMGGGGSEDIYDDMILNLGNCQVIKQLD